MHAPLLCSRNIDDKLDILEQEGLPSSIDFVLTAGEAPSTQMLAFLRLMQLNGMDSFLLEALFRWAARVPGAASGRA
jgi:hypothetical protein